MAAEKPAEPSQRATPAAKTSGGGGAGVDVLRSRVASVVWLVAVLAALVLAVGALCVALKLERDNTIVRAILDLANAIDFNEFKRFEGDNAEVKTALVNWGIAAVIWLTIGKVLDKIIRP